MLRIADQVELAGPVEPFKVSRLLAHLRQEDGSVKTGEDEHFTYFDRLAVFVGAVGIITDVRNGRALVHWTHHLPDLKPPRRWHLLSTLDLLHRPYYPDPQHHVR